MQDVPSPDDLLADGMPEFIGFIDGGVAAWTRDMDGDAATRSDQRIAVSEYNWDSESFGPITLLGDAAGGLNTDASLAYDPTNKPVLAWVRDSTSADAVFLEVHRDPARALSDGPNALRLELVADLLGSLREIHRLVRGATPPGTPGRAER